METIVSVHPFEIVGLGRAPFRLIGMEKRVYSAAPGHQQPAGTCDACSQGIMYCYSIRSSCGKVSTVGCDCVMKLDRDDNRLVSAVQRAKADYARKVRDEEREAARLEREQRIEAGLQAERERNGGKTDAEIEAIKSAEADAFRRQQFERENGWLLEVLDHQTGDFCQSMARKLEAAPLVTLSAKCIDILRDIFAKHHGRRGGKAYNAAIDQFNSHL
jgi:hypothetical protein